MSIRLKNTFDKILTCLYIYLYLLLHSFSPFLKTGVMFACFKTDGNLEFLADSLKLECKNFDNSLIIL